MSRSAHLAIWLYVTASVVFVLDRFTKLWAERALADRPPLDVIPGLLRFVYTTNSGGAFSIGQSAPWLFAGATLLVSVAIVVASFRLTHRWIAVALGLVLGGALGNLADRVLRGEGLSGRVVDFIDVRVWPVFNLADSAVVVGAILLAFSAILYREA